MKICQLRAQLYYADRRTDVTNLIDAYCNVVNTPTDCRGHYSTAVNQQNIERLSVIRRRGNSVKLTYTWQMS